MDNYSQTLGVAMLTAKNNKVNSTYHQQDSAALNNVGIKY